MHGARDTDPGHGLTRAWERERAARVPQATAHRDRSDTRYAPFSAASEWRRPCCPSPHAVKIVRYVSRVLLLATSLAALVAGEARGVTLPPGFQDTAVFTGLALPTAVKFASDGRVFVAEKSGIIKVYDSLGSTTPTIFADFRTNVHNFWDRGLLSLALHPAFPTTP